MSDRKVVWGADDHRYAREWLGGVSGNWWREKTYRTKFFAILAAILHSPGAKQRVIDTKAVRDDR